MSFSNLTKYKARFRQWGACARCDKPLDSGEEFAHALFPQSQGGPEDESNCVMLCAKCQNEAHDDPNSQSAMAPPLGYFPYANLYGGHAPAQAGAPRRR